MAFKTYTDLALRSLSILGTDDSLHYKVGAPPFY